MNAIDLLKEQHRHVEKLLKHYQSLEKAPAGQKSKVFGEIADALAVHATIEEKIFYPGVKVAQTEEILRESLEEHLAVKRLIADMLDLRPTDQTFDVKLKVLEGQVTHHVEKEEKELFPKVKKMMTEQHLKELGQRMEELFDELKQGEPRSNVPSENGRGTSVGLTRRR